MYASLTSLKMLMIESYFNFINALPGTTPACPYSIRIYIERNQELYTLFMVIVTPSMSNVGDYL